MSDFREDSPFYAAEKKPPVRLSGAQWALLGWSLALAALVVWLFDWDAYWKWGQMPGFGMTLLLWGGMAAAWVYGGRRRLRGWTLWLTAFDALLAACYAIYANGTMQHLNLIVLAGTLPASVYGMGGTLRRGDGSPAMLSEAWARAAGGLFAHAARPFRAALASRRGGGKNALAFAFGIGLCLPVLTVVVVLLCNADEVFQGVLRGGIQSVENLNAGEMIGRSLWTLALTLIIFSSLYAVREPGKEARVAGEPLRLPALSGGMLLVLLDAVYALFVCVQFYSLFGGAESAAMAGGYAQYARSGFYQLVLVALINMGVLFALRSMYPSGGIFRALLSLLVCETAVILVSAAWRMNLYIQAYGLSVLRVLTLWGMAAIAVWLILAAVKLFAPGVRVFPAMLALLTAMWLGLNAMNMDRVIADHNAARVLGGAIQADQLDLAHLTTLSPDALDALEALDRAGIEGAGAAARELLRRRPASWTGMSVSWILGQHRTVA